MSNLLDAWATEDAAKTAKQTTITSLTPAAGYYSSNFVPVSYYPRNHPTDPWDFVAAKNKLTLFAFILPMPMSYSSDGVWNMEFAKAFDANGTGYGGDAGYSIGLQLHYGNGPAMFDLYQCANDLTCNTPVPIGKGYHTTLRNTGALRIVMKAPDSNDACDYHVRSVYRPMLRLLDSANPLSGGHNSNQNYGYVDPARAVNDQGVGNYADLTCFAGDDQRFPDTAPVGALAPEKEKKQVNPMQPEMLTISTIAGQLQTLIPEIQELKLKQGLMQQIVAESANLKADSAFPLPALSRFAQLLNAAADEAQKSKNNDLTNKLRILAVALQPKNGADCRAALMLVK